MAMRAHRPRADSANAQTLLNKTSGISACAQAG